MVTIKRTWESVHFYAKKNKESARIELSINRDTGDWSLNTSREEAVSFKNDSIGVAELKIEAIKAAVKYAKDDLKDSGKTKPSLPKKKLNSIYNAA